MVRHKTLAIVLAGGVGSRLRPLTRDRAKPAVPFGGKYRIIDFALSNCLHSGLRRVLVLTQYKSHSLQMHLRDGWSIFNSGIGEYITAVPPQKRTGDSWYSGTADAIYQNLFLLERSGADRVLILSGDHIYRMDYAAMVELSQAKQADVVVACMQVPIRDASAFGVMGVNEDERIVSFEEKPAAPQSIPGDPQHALASMGVYVFDRELLCRTVAEDHQLEDSTHDFGRDILPKLVASHNVYAYRFGAPAGRVSVDRYWRDVGTIDAYYEANMDLLKTTPPLDLYQHDWPIRTAESQSPPARSIAGRTGHRAEVENVIFGAGTVVAGASVSHSVLFRNVHLDELASVKHSILFDEVHVGAGAKLRNCVIDKRVRVPAGEVIGYDAAADKRRFDVSDSGVVVVSRLYRFPDSDREEGIETENTVRLDETTVMDSVLPPATERESQKHYRG